MKCRVCDNFDQQARCVICEELNQTFPNPLMDVGEEVTFGTSGYGFKLLTLEWSGDRNGKGHWVYKGWFQRDGSYYKNAIVDEFLLAREIKR